MARRPIDFAAVRRLYSPLQYLLRLEWTGRDEGRGTWRGPCPIHRSRSMRSRSLAVTGPSFFCHACEARGDVLDLVGLLAYMNVYDAALYVCEMAGAPVPFLPVQHNT